MVSQVQEIIRALPERWWQNDTICRILGHEYGRHLIGLHLVVEMQGRVQQTVYTGFGLYYRKRPMWVSAAHVVDQIGQLLRDSRVKLRHAMWLDGCHVDGHGRYRRLPLPTWSSPAHRTITATSA